MNEGLKALQHLYNEYILTEYPDSILEDIDKDKETIEKSLKENEQYKAIEEKWGISIVLMDRILDYLDEVYLNDSDKPFYVKYFDGIDTVNPVHMEIDRRNKSLLETYSADGSGPTEYPFSEYGKTWALTREELEK